MATLFQKKLKFSTVLVCSMAGFEKFLQRKWYETIFSWQSKKMLGCFELPKHNLSKTFDEIYDIKKKSENNRVKRYDYVISTDTQSCSAHFTGVGVAYIGLQLRYFLETCAETFLKVD